MPEIFGRKPNSVQAQIGEHEVIVPIGKTEYGNLVRVIQENKVQGAGIAFALGLFALGYRLLRQSGQKQEMKQAEKVFLGRELKQNEKRSYADFYRNNKDYVHTFIRQGTKGYGEDVMEEITAQLFFKFLRQWHRYQLKDETELRKLLNTSIHNALVQAYKKHKSEVGFEDELFEHEEDFEEKLIEREKQRELAELIHRLPAESKLLVVLKLAGLENKEIGSILGVPQGTIKMRFHTITKSMKRFY